MKPRTTHEGHELFKARTRAIFEELIEKMDLGWIHWVLCLDDSARHDDPDCAADTHSQWQYRLVKITVYVPSVHSHDDDDLRRVLVHEIVHGLANPMESLIGDEDGWTQQCELAVENISRAILELL